MLFCNDTCLQAATSGMMISGVIYFSDGSLAVDCSNNSRSGPAAQEAALVLEPFFAGTCPEGEEPCLPLLPVKKEPLRM